MSGLGLIAGVLALNLILVLVGYSILHASLRTLAPRAWASYAGVALLVGAGLVLAVMNALSVTGLSMGTAAFALCSLALAAAGVAAGRLVPPAWRDRIAPAPVPARETSRLGDGIATAAACAIAGILVLAVIGGFRSSPNLDDTWNMWLPKGLALAQGGLDARFFGAGTEYVSLPNPDYPFWWSLLANLDTSFVGTLDLRALNAQLAILVAAFVGGVARLMWGYVRPELLWGGLLLLVLSPELIRQAQGGGADVPLAIYLTLFVVVAVRWLVTGEGFALALSFVFAAAVLGIKREGMPELFAFLIVLSAFWIVSRRRRVGLLWLAALGAFLLAGPWLVWQAVHDVPRDIPLANFVDPGHLLAQDERVRPTIDAYASHLFGLQEWTLVVPLFLIVSLLAVLRNRRALWLAPVALFLVGFALLVWVMWADPLDLSYRLGTASRRIVDPLALLAAVSLPVLAEALARGALPRTTANQPSRSEVSRASGPATRRS